MNHLLLHSPNDKPFGALHPATDHLLSKAYSVIISDEGKRAYNETLAPEQARINSVQEFDLQQDAIAAQAIVRSLQTTYQQHTELAMQLVNTGTQPLKVIMDNATDSFIKKYEQSLEQVRHELSKQWEENRKKQTKLIINWIYELSVSLTKDYIEGTSALGEYMWKNLTDIIFEQTANGKIPEIDFYDTLSEQQKEMFDDVTILNDYIQHFSDTFIIDIISNKDFTKEYHLAVKKKNEVTLLNCYLSMILEKNNITTNEQSYKIALINELESTNQMSSLLKRLKELYRLGDLLECTLIPETDYGKYDDVSFQFGKKKMVQESEDESEDESEEEDEESDEDDEEDDEEENEEDEDEEEDEEEEDDEEEDNEEEDEEEDDEEEEDEVNAEKDKKIVKSKEPSTSWLKTTSKRVKQIKIDTRKSFLQNIEAIRINKIVQHETIKISLNDARDFFAKAAQRIFHNDSITDICNKKQIINMLKDRAEKMKGEYKETTERDYSSAMEELLAIVIKEQGWEQDQSYIQQWSESSLSKKYRMHRFIDPEKEMYPIYIRETLLAKQKAEATDYYLNVASELFPKKNIIDLISLTRKELQAIYRYAVKDNGWKTIPNPPSFRDVSMYWINERNEKGELVAKPIPFHEYHAIQDYYRINNIKWDKHLRKYPDLSVSEKRDILEDSRRFQNIPIVRQMVQLFINQQNKKEYKEFTIKYTKSTKIYDIPLPVDKTPYVIQPGDPFHPLAYVQFYIDTFGFPTIMHYVFFKKSQSIERPKKIIKDSYITHMLNCDESIWAKIKDFFLNSIDNCVFKSYEELVTNYNESKENYLSYLIQRRMNYLLQKRYIYETFLSERDYENKTFQKFTIIELTALSRLLASTKNEYETISYEDPSDEFLGKNNIIGKELMAIRDRLIESYPAIGLPLELDIIKSSITEEMKDEAARTLSIHQINELITMSKEFKLAYHASFNDSIACMVELCWKCLLEKLPNVLHVLTIPMLPFDFIPTIPLTKKTDDVCLTTENRQLLWKIAFIYYKSIEALGGHIGWISEHTQLVAQARLTLDESDSFESYYKQFFNPNKKVKGIEPKQKQSMTFNENVLYASDKIVDKTHIDFRKFVVTDESHYSCLKPWHIEQLQKIFQTWFHPDRVSLIVDATANIGVDSIHFCKFFENATIYSYEIEPFTASLLQQNINTFKCVNNKVFVKDFLLSHHDFKTATFIYIDAPWGGSDYKKVKTKMDLFMHKHSINVKEVAKKLILSGKTEDVILKVPSNFNFGDLSPTFLVEAEDVLGKGNKVEFVLLHLRMSQKMKDAFNMKGLIVNTFKHIFNAILSFKEKIMTKQIEQDRLKAKKINKSGYALEGLYYQTKPGHILVKEDEKTKNAEPIYTIGGVSYVYKEVIQPSLTEKDIHFAFKLLTSFKINYDIPLFEYEEQNYYNTFITAFMKTKNIANLEYVEKMGKTLQGYVSWIIHHSTPELVSKLIFFGDKNCTKKESADIKQVEDEFEFEFHHALEKLRTMKIQESREDKGKEEMIELLRKKLKDEKYDEDSESEDDDTNEYENGDKFEIEEDDEEDENNHDLVVNAVYDDLFTSDE